MQLKSLKLKVCFHMSKVFDAVFDAFDAVSILLYLHIQSKSYYPCEDLPVTYLLL